jgi:hypothetical protein
MPLRDDGADAARGANAPAENRGDGDLDEMSKCSTTALPKALVGLTSLVLLGRDGVTTSVITVPPVATAMGAPSRSSAAEELLLAAASADTAQGTPLDDAGPPKDGVDSLEAESAMWGERGCYKVL